MSKGTSQHERMPEALDPESFKVDPRSTRDLLEEARELAETVPFYETSGKEASGTWAPFFEEAHLSPDQTGENPPHIGLLWTFLKLFGYTQQKLNALTASHLHFFYHNILGQEKRKALPDKIFVFFELARNVQQFLLPERTSLPAGKDGQGKKTLYLTDRQAFLSQAGIRSFKAIHTQKHPGSPVVSFPVANSRDGLGSPLEEGEGWAPFGDPENKGLSAKIGFGIDSSVLFLKEGVRTIHLSFSLTGNKAPELSSLDPAEFDVLLTGSDDWFRKDVDRIDHRDERLTFLVHLDETDPPVTEFYEETHRYPLPASGNPMLLIVLKQGFTYNRYALLQSLRINEITVRAKVEKVRDLVIRNDFGELDAGRAFQPFGYTPVKGANLYLGYEETFIKPLSGLSVQINWQGLPESFKTWYEGYLGPTNSLVNRNEDFKVKAAVRHQKEWFEIQNPTDISGEFLLFSERLQLDPDIRETEGKTKHNIPYHKAVENEDGLIRLTLSSPANAFGHTLYPSVYAKAIMSQLQDRPDPIPNEPYTPVVESVELAYSAEEEAGRFFYIKPFGIEQVPVQNTPLLAGEFHHAGSLYLGVENLHPPQQLAVFFFIEPESTEDKPDPEFYYLSDSGWSRFTENQLLSDTTSGLKQTGILLLNLPADITSGNPTMPPGFHWIRISVPDHPERFDQILDVRTNAVSCTLRKEDSRNSIEVNTLAPFTINSLAKKRSEIKKIEQPYPSFGGRPAENDTGYFTRVSEKMRHKMRSITAWDYERLILEQFPEIYKVSCLQHRDARGRTLPGNIHLIVIPSLKQVYRSKVLKPMVPNNTLTEIKTYIEQLSPSGVTIHVTNPYYEEIKIVAWVSFNIQADAGFYTKQLQLDLRSFLSPWAFREDLEIQLGGKLYRSSIIEFIESRHYVDFIASIRILKNGRLYEEEEISPDAHTLIVSSDTHDIEAVERDNILCQTNQGIGQMIVDINFEVQ